MRRPFLCILRSENTKHIQIAMTLFNQSIFNSLSKSERKTPVNNHLSCYLLWQVKVNDNNKIEKQISIFFEKSSYEKKCKTVVEIIKMDLQFTLLKISNWHQQDLLCSIKKLDGPFNPFPNSYKWEEWPSVLLVFAKLLAWWRSCMKWIVFDLLVHMV